MGKDVLLFLQVEFLKDVLTVPVLEDAHEASAVTPCGICSHSRTVRKTASASLGSSSEDAGSPVVLQTNRYSQKQGGTCHVPVLFTGAWVMLMKAEAGPLHYGAPRISLGFFQCYSLQEGCDSVKSLVASDDDMCVCLSRASFLRLSCSCLAADGKVRDCPLSGLTEQACCFFFFNLLFRCLLFLPLCFLNS